MTKHPAQTSLEVNGLSSVYEVINLSRAHVQYYGRVSEAETGASFFSLPMGRWHDVESQDSAGARVFDLFPDAGDGGAVLRYDPGQDRICRHDRLRGVSGPWHPSYQADRAWKGEADAAPKTSGWRKGCMLAAGGAGLLINVLIAIGSAAHAFA